MPKPATIDEYIAGFPTEIQTILQTVRATIHAAVPDAQECISYGMPAFRLHRVLVYFAANKQHLGFYPTGAGIAAFADELAPFGHSKGAVRFPYDRPMPLDLIARIARGRSEEESGDSAMKTRFAEKKT
jgi:uncharacterized protein YdhG (YjbR/CyaY superfamily)